MKRFDKSYDINEEGINLLVEDLGQYLEDNDTARREVLRLRLAVEELLLRVMDDQRMKADADTGTVSLRCRKKGGGQTILLKYRGAAFDPTETQERGSWVLTTVCLTSRCPSARLHLCREQRCSSSRSACVFRKCMVCRSTFRGSFRRF